jgi:hypothetical protein
MRNRKKSTSKFGFVALRLLDHHRAYPFLRQRYQSPGPGRTGVRGRCDTATVRVGKESGRRSHASSPCLVARPPGPRGFGHAFGSFLILQSITPASSKPPRAATDSSATAVAESALVMPMLMVPPGWWSCRSAVACCFAMAAAFLVSLCFVVSGGIVATGKLSLQAASTPLASAAQHHASSLS